MEVQIVALKGSATPSAHEAAVTYDIIADVDGKRRTFTASVVLTQIDEYVMQSVSFRDATYADVFRRHQTILTKMGHVVLAFYNNADLVLPIQLDES